MTRLYINWKHIRRIWIWEDIEQLPGVTKQTWATQPPLYCRDLGEYRLHTCTRAKLKHTIDTDRWKEASTQEDRETMTTCTQGRERELGCRLYPSHSVCFLFTEPGTPDCFFSVQTERKASGAWGDILWISQKLFWIRIVDHTFKANGDSHVIKWQHSAL